MPDFKNCIQVLRTSIYIIIGTHFIMNYIGQLTEFPIMHLQASTFISIMAFILTISTISYLWSLYLHIFKNTDIMHIHRGHLGICIALSSCFYTIRCFYLSFYNFEESLSNLYTAFALMFLSIAVLYGKTGIPSSYIVMRASHLSMFLAFLGLSMMIMPNMMNSAFVVAFTATFLLLVSVVLFVMKTSRCDIVFYESQSREENVESNLEADLVSSNTEDIVEVFSDVYVLGDSTSVKEMSYASRIDNIIDGTIYTPRCVTSKAEEVNNNEVVKGATDEMVDEILNDMTEQMKSLEDCLKCLLFEKSSCETSVELPDNSASNQVLKHRTYVCRGCRHRYF